MKIIKNSIFPLPGYLAINMFGVLFVRRELWDRLFEDEWDEAVRHEQIHTAQMKELWYVGFYIIYILEWIYRLIFHTKTAYIGLSFEREAYAHQNDEGYLERRKHFAQWRKDEQEGR